MPPPLRCHPLLAGLAGAVVTPLVEMLMLSTICFNLAEITNGNDLENSKYGHISRTASRLQMVSKSSDFWQGERKTLILPANMLGILI